MQRVLFLFLFIISLYAKDEVYFLPQDGNKAENKITQLLSTAHENIKIAIYTFTNKKFLKAIKNVARKGIKVYIVADYESNKDQSHHSVIPQLRKLRNVYVKLKKGTSKGKYKGIMHIKLLIIDDITVSFGSANYTYSAFHKNYELLYINNDWTFTRKFVKIFDQLYNQ